jgi:transcriptional regulator with XRE-family HTH domain
MTYSKRQVRAVVPRQPLGGVLAGVRRSRGIRQDELARRLGLTPATLSRIEHGGGFRVGTLLDIARELKLEPILVPKEHVPAVRALLRDLQAPTEAPDRPRFA